MLLGGLWIVVCRMLASIAREPVIYDYWGNVTHRDHTYWHFHYYDVIMGAMASEITSLTTVYSTVYSGEDQRKHRSSASLAFVRGIHWWPVNFLHKGPVTRKMFPLDDVIMWLFTDGILEYISSNKIYCSFYLQFTAHVSMGLNDIMYVTWTCHEIFNHIMRPGC